MEKLFLTITRWLMIAGAAVSFVVLIGGAIYELALYQKSLDRSIANNSVYHKKDPVVSLDGYKYIQENKIQKIKQEQVQKERERKALKNYILDVINNGSSGHGFAGVMPSKLIKGKQAEQIADFIVNKLKGDKPKYFAACAACHGDDGNGTKGEYPSLLELPIYNGLASYRGNSSKYAPSDSVNDQEKNLTGLKLYSAHLVAIINKYSLLSDQNGTTTDEMYDYVNKIKDSLDDKYFDEYKKQLIPILKELLKHTKSMISKREDIRYAIDWRDYLKWSLNDFISQIKKEESRYQNHIYSIEMKHEAKINKANVARAKFYSTATVLGIALVIFILFTIILVLFKIEANTRGKIEE